MLDRIMTLKVPPAIITVVAAGIMWGIYRLSGEQWLEFSGQRWTALAFFAIGGVFGLLGLLQFYSHSTSVNPHKPDNASALVQRGIYRLSRNPMYLGLLAMLTGWGFYLGSLLSFLVLPGFVEYMNRYQILPEEQVLTRKFGQAYLKYKEQVDRWI